MERKLNEFLNLTQGTRTALQYSQVFNNLCQYADYHADSEAKKIACFRRGLNSKLKERLVNVNPVSYSAFVSRAIAQEDEILAHKADKKRKGPAAQTSGQNQRFRLAPIAAPPRAPPSGRWVVRAPQNAPRYPPAQPQQSQPQAPRPNFQQQVRPAGGYKCFKCGSDRHLIKDCPQNRQLNQPNRGRPKVQVR